MPTFILSICLACSLASFGTVEEDPHREIVREFLEAAQDTRRREQEVAGTERLPAGVAHERPAARDHHVSLVPRRGDCGSLPTGEYTLTWRLPCRKTSC